MNDDKTMPELPPCAGTNINGHNCYTAAQMHAAYAEGYTAAQTPPRSEGVTELPHPVALQSVFESARCLGVAQAKGDSSAVTYWQAESERYVAAAALAYAAAQDAEIARLREALEELPKAWREQSDKERSGPVSYAMRTCAAELEAALAGPLAQGWRGIESAPRDGRILGWNKLDGALVFEPYNYGSNGQFEGWVVPGDSNDTFSMPTHWMPLPTPPTDAKEKGSD